MKLSFIILMLAFLQVSASSLAQKVNIQVKDASINEVFYKLTQQTGHTFTADAALIKKLGRISLNMSNKTLKEVLEKCFDGYDVKMVFNEEDKIVVIKSNRTTIQPVINVTGKVTDEKGEPLAGATVGVKGTPFGVVTNAEGQYSIKIPTGNNILIFSIIGFERAEQEIGTRKVIDVMLKAVATALQETVVIGYGTVKKSDLTGSLSQLEGDKFKDQTVNSVETTLAGRVAGVRVVDGAQPGAGGSVTIRGANSMLGGTEPLYVIDGIPVEPNNDARGQSLGGSRESALNFIDPASIEKITVLKDASATAIYGARGANGVVLITTKQGKFEKSELRFNYSTDASGVTRERRVLIGPEFADWMNMSMSNVAWLSKSWFEYKQRQFDNGEITVMPTVTPWSSYNTPAEYNNPKWQFDGISRPLPNDPNLPNTNWQDEVFQTGITHNYGLSYSGGYKNGTYSSGLSYLNQEGVVMGSSYKRINAYANLNHSVSEKFKITTSLNLNRGQANAIMANNGDINRNVISKINSFAPTNKPLQPGDTFEDFDFNDPNFMDDPVVLVTRIADDKEQLNLLGRLNMRYRVMPGLWLSGTGALSYYANNRDTYWPTTTFKGQSVNGEATSGRNQFYKSLGQLQANYNKRFNKVHNFDATAVYSYEKFDNREDFVRVQDFPSDNLGYKNLASGLEYFVPVNQFYNSTLQSLLGRLNYNYKSKYYVTASLRADGSSKFAANNKWGIFPSAALAWTMSEENFMKNQTVVSNMKLRLSYGRTGSQAISNYQSLAQLALKNYVFDDEKVVGFYESNLENPNLKWEATDQYNAGIDMGFLKNRLNVTLDLYSKRTNDLLMIIETVPSTGFATKVDNIGSVSNKGVELDVNYLAINKKLKWTVNGNLAFNRSKVLYFGESGFQYSTFTVANSYKPIIFMEGKPMGAFFGYQKEKIFESWEEIAASAQKTAYVGDMKYKDLNNDGVLNNDDMSVIGDPNPKALFGITNEFTYKNFDLNFLISGQIGGDIYSVENMRIESNFRNQATLKAAENSWVPSEPTPRGTWTLPDGTQFSSVGYQYPFGNTDPYTATPMFNWSAAAERTRITDEYVQDATYVKLKTISLGYSFKSNALTKMGVKSLRAYLSATNVLTITKFDGYDPEISAFTNNAAFRGLDFGTYPLARSYRLGVNVIF